MNIIDAIITNIKESGNDECEVIASVFSDMTGLDMNQTYAKLGSLIQDKTLTLRSGRDDNKVMRHYISFTDKAMIG